MFKYISGFNVSRIVVSIALFILLFLTGIIAFSRFENSQSVRQEQGMSAVAVRTAAVIEHELEEAVYGAFALSMVIQQTGAELSPNDFETIVEQLLQEYPDVSNLQLAPKGIITQIYPHDERLIGHDHLADSKHEFEARMAMAAKRPNLAGPLLWTEAGESALVGHVPVYLGDEFWGFTISFIWLAEFIDPLGLDQLTTNGYSYRLSRADPRTGETQIILETDTKHALPSVEVPIAVPDSPNWILSLSLNQPIIAQWFLSLVYSIIFGFSAFIAYSLHRFLAIPEVLSKRVKERTKALDETNLLLKQEVEERTFIQQELKLARLALEESSSGVVITKVVENDGKIRHPVDFANKAFTRLTGYSSAEIIGHSCRMLQGSETSLEAISLIRTTLKNGVHCKVVLKNYRKDGSEFWNELTISPIHNDDEQLTGFIGFQVDVTERLRAQASLRKQYEEAVLIRKITEQIRAELATEQIFQTTVDLLGRNLNLDRCIIHDVGPEQKYINCVAEYLVPGSKTMLNAQVPIVGNTHAEKVLDQDQAVITVDVFNDPLMKAAHDVCTTFQIRSILAIRTSFQNQPNGVLALHQCKTVRQWTDEEIKLLEAVAMQVGIALGQAKLMEEKVAQQKLLSEQNNNLIQANQAAAEANASKDKFLAMISHELRTPLNGIIGMASLISDTELTVEQAEFTRVIRSSSNILLTLVNDILDFSKIESGHLEFETIVFNLQKCINDAILLLQEKAHNKGIQLERSIAPDVPLKIVGDVTRLRQVLVNLLSNAIKFTKVGYVQIAVTRTPAHVTHQTVSVDSVYQASESLSPSLRAEPHLVLQFSVKDTGIGIATKDQKKLFQPFRQVDASINRQYGGSGLGLAICKQLVLGMGGDIWVDSEVGQGTTFSFTLPTHAHELNEKEIRNNLLESEDANRDSLGHEKVVAQEAVDTFLLNPETAKKTKILLAEDNRVNQQIATLMLSNIGYVVDTAGNGIEVLEALERQPYQIILMDIQMPEMDGLTATQRIREIYPLEQQPHIIALTASAMQGDRERFLAAGMQDYLAKPFDKAALLKVLSRAEESIAANVVIGANDADLNGSLEEESASADVLIDATIPCLNHQTLEGIRKMLGADSLSLLEEVINTYLIDTPDNIDSILGAIDKGNNLALAQAAHALRSSSANLGLERLSHLCEILERHGNGCINIIPSEYKPCLQSEYDAAKAELRKIKQKA